VDGTSFVGRERELAELIALLSRARLITVTGTGGVGKTRLARHAATAATARFPGGVYIAELSALTDPSLLLNTVAAVLGLQEQDTVSASHAILGYVRHRKILLVLDTCEHLIDACAALAETLLQEAADVTVLATSRQPLDVAGETSFPLAPLKVPVPGARPRPGDAVDLFWRRAAAAVPTFAVTRENTDDAIRLCRRLDGIPLAIELAAVRLRALPLKELASRVPLRDPGQRGGDQRHQTLNAAIEWSYNLCTPAEKALWERLSVFAGSFGIGAAEEVCAGRELPREDVLATLISLVDKSVLVRENPVSQNASARYRLLDTIREFGLGRLGGSGIEPGVRGRFVERYRTMAAYFGDHVLDDEQLDRFGALREEHDSIRAALEWSLGSSRADPGPDAGEQGVQLALSLFFYWHMAGLYHEGIYWLDKVLALRPGPGPDRARALAMRCAFATPAGVATSAIADGQEALRMATELGEPEIGARASLFLEHAFTVAGQHDQAREQSAVTERQLTAVQDRIGLAIHTVYLTNLHHHTGDTQASLDMYQRGTRIIGGRKERWLSSWLHLLGGFTLFQLDRLDDAAAVWKLALEAKAELSDSAGVAYGLDVFALLAWFDGRHHRAAWLIGAADNLWERAGGVRYGGNPLFTELYDTIVADAEQKIGVASIAELRAEGRALPVDKAVALAVGGSDALPGPESAAEGLLTSREREIVTLAGSGLSSRSIAERLSISKRTVDAHIEDIYAKLGVSSRVELAIWLSEQG
jgi:non-specific serine/threonine protein kinase